MNNIYTISIDPSINTAGIAIFKNKELIESFTKNSYQLAIFLYENLKNYHYVVLEDSRLQKKVWSKNAKSVGALNGSCKIIEQAIDYENKIRKKDKKEPIKLQCVSPKNKGSKISAEILQQEHKIKINNQHEADAVNIATQFLYMFSNIIF